MNKARLEFVCVHSVGSTPTIIWRSEKLWLLFLVSRVQVAKEYMMITQNGQNGLQGSFSLTHTQFDFEHQQVGKLCAQIGMRPIWTGCGPNYREEEEDVAATDHQIFNQFLVLFTVRVLVYWSSISLIDDGL